MFKLLVLVLSKFELLTSCSTHKDLFLAVLEAEEPKIKTFMTGEGQRPFSCSCFALYGS